MKSIPLALAVAALAAPAFAAPVWSAHTVKPTSQSGFVADTVIWNCKHSNCHSVSSTSQGDDLDACTALARKVGALTSFSVGTEPYDAQRLATCNGAAPKT